MATISKRARAISEKVQAGKIYTPKDAFALLKEIPAAKFREGVDVAVRLLCSPQLLTQLLQSKPAQT